MFEVDTFVLSKGGMFVGKGYLYDGMFKLSIINNKNVIAYVCNSFYVWHFRLGYVHFKWMNDMVKLNLMPNMNVSDEKCTICTLTKITRKPFPNVQRSSNILDLVHSDICEMNGQLHLNGKRCFITFIDYYSRDCYVYLLSSKDEVLEKFKNLQEWSWTSLWEILKVPKVR